MGGRRVSNPIGLHSCTLIHCTALLYISFSPTIIAGWLDPWLWPREIYRLCHGQFYHGLLYGEPTAVCSEGAAIGKMWAQRSTAQRMNVCTYGCSYLYMYFDFALPAQGLQTEMICMSYNLAQIILLCWYALAHVNEHAPSWVPRFVFRGKSRQIHCIETQ